MNLSISNSKISRVHGNNFSIPAGSVDEDTFEDGLGFDGSSIRGWKAINESDMLVIPDPVTAFIDPFLDNPTSLFPLHAQFKIR